MKKSLIALAVMAAFGMASVRARTHDVAFGFRMGAGFPGDINRTHPFEAIADQMDPTVPVRLYGDPGLLTATGLLRGFNIGDTALTKLDGVLVRPYPTSQTTGGMASTIGAATPPGGNSVVDRLRSGFIMVKCNNTAAGAPVKGAAVFVWCVASAGADVLGGFRAAASAGSTAAIANARWASGADANGFAELEVWAA